MEIGAAGDWPAWKNIHAIHSAIGDENVLIRWIVSDVAMMRFTKRSVGS